MILHATPPDKGAASLPVPVHKPRSVAVTRESHAPIAHCPGCGHVGELLHNTTFRAVPGWERYGNCAACLSTVCAPGEHAGVMLATLMAAVAGSEHGHEVIGALLGMQTAAREAGERAHAGRLCELALQLHQMRDRLRLGVGEVWVEVTVEVTP